jgi:hypothetical protein
MTPDFPDDTDRPAKLEAVERGSTPGQLVMDELQRERPDAQRPGKRLTRPPIKLAADAPLRGLGPEAVKRLDGEAVGRAEEGKAYSPGR